MGKRGEVGLRICSVRPQVIDVGSRQGADIVGVQVLSDGRGFQFDIIPECGTFESIYCRLQLLPVLRGV